MELREGILRVQRAHLAYIYIYTHHIAYIASYCSCYKGLAQRNVLWRSAKQKSCQAKLKLLSLILRSPVCVARALHKFGLT